MLHQPIYTMGDLIREMNKRTRGRGGQGIEVTVEGPGGGTFPVAYVEYDERGDSTGRPEIVIVPNFREG